jgi:glutamate synthase (NADPH/NADH) large chain
MIKHLHYTNSARAREILEHWEDYLPRFVKIMPVDYRRALTQLQAEQMPAQEAATSMH